MSGRFTARELELRAEEQLEESPEILEFARNVLAVGRPVALHSATA